MPIINQIVKGGGTTPTGTIQITNNGVTDVTNYASADVQVPTTAPALYREYSIDGNGKLSYSTAPVMDFSNVTEIGYAACESLYSYNTNITGIVDLHSLTVIQDNGCSGMYSPCPNITGVNLSSLSIVAFANCVNSMFAGCTGLLSGNITMGITSFSGTTTAKSMFSGCTGLTNTNFLQSLQTINATQACEYMFYNCTGLTSATFTSLSQIGGSNSCRYMFAGCTNLTDIYYPALIGFLGSSSVKKSVFTNMCMGVTNVTLHFPSNMQSEVGTLTGYSTTAPFGATAGTVLFDLPATA